MSSWPDSEWNVVPLGHLVEVLDSRRVPVSARERAKRAGSVPYYGATGQVGWIDAPIFDEPLVLLGEDGVQFFDPAKPKAYLIDGPAWVNNHAHVLRPLPVIDRRFLNQYLNTADFRGYANGTTRLKLTQAAMKQLPVPVPPIAEQRRIVEILEDHLSRLDAADAALAAAKARLNALQRSSLDRWFGLAEPSVALGDLLHDITAGRSFGTAATRAASDEWGIIKVSAMTWGEFRADENKRVSENLADPRYEIHEGDLLVSRANTSEYVGASVLVGPVRPRLLLSDKSLRLTPRDDVDPEWLWRALQAPSARRQISALATGTKASMRNISQQSLRRIRLPAAMPVEQRRALANFAGIDNEARRLHRGLVRQVERGTLLRRSLLTAAFSGRLTGGASDIDLVEEMASA